MFDIKKQSLMNLIIGKGEKFWRPTYFSSFEFVHTGSKTKFSQQVPKVKESESGETFGARRDCLEDTSV